MSVYKVALKTAAISLIGWGLSACQPGGNNPPPDFSAGADLSARDLAPAMPKGVYTLSNDLADNKIFAYTRAADGSLTLLNSYSTGGKGSGDSLGDQGALVFDATQNLFFAVNAGDNTISMMSLKSDGTLALVAGAQSGGFRPVSITVSGSVVYVVNAGRANFGDANITGFQIAQNRLTLIANSTKPLSSVSPQPLPMPAQIQFNQNGTLLVVTEKMTNKILTYTVNAGVPTGPMVQASNGMTPFGFAFSMNQQLIVSEGGAGATSSYSLAATGLLTTVSPSVTSGQLAPCWVAVVRDTAYVTNAMSNNVTSYKISPQGALTLGSAVAGMTGMGPTDLDATDGNEYLYVLNGRDDTITIFTINTDGSLTKKTDFTGLPMNAVGLVAR